MNKQLMQERFSKHLEDYNSNATVQKMMAEHLVKKLSCIQYENVLELGCGTGFLTKEINKKIKYKNYLAVDIVCDCKKYIEKIDKRINFINSDFENYIDKSDCKYDLIVSNASLQWTDTFAEIMLNLKNMLNPQGELIFSTFGNENFKEIFSVTELKLNYHSKQDYEKIFKNLEYESKTYVMNFKTPKEVLMHLKLTGVNSLEQKHWTKSNLKEFEKKYFELCSGEPILTYNPVYIKYQNKTVG